MKKFRVVQIGLGGRGYSLYNGILKNRKDTDFIGFCDPDFSRCEKFANIAVDGHERPEL